MTALHSVDHRPHPDPEAAPPASREPPGKAVRHDGLTPARQAEFLDALAATGSVSAAAAAIGVSRAALYKLRSHPDAAAFRAGWDDALRSAVAVLAETAFERAIHGAPEPVWYKGEQVGERMRHNDRLLMFLLRAHDPETYAPRKPAPVARTPRPERPRPGRTPAREIQSLLSTLSTSPPAEDDAELEDAAFRATLRELRTPPPAPQRLSKRNARRLAAKARLKM